MDDAKKILYICRIVHPIGYLKYIMYINFEIRDGFYKYLIYGILSKETYYTIYNDYIRNSTIKSFAHYSTLYINSNVMVCMYRNIITKIDCVMNFLAYDYSKISIYFNLFGDIIEFEFEPDYKYKANLIKYIRSIDYEFPKGLYEN
jgi:hypothetical protein